MRSALDMFSPCADRLPPDAKRVLATLFDDVAQLAYDAWNAAFDEFMSAARGIAYWEIPARACELLRRTVPALGVLSDKDLVVVSRVGREAMIARKNRLDPTDTVALLQGTYAAGVDALAWSFLYSKFATVPPTTPLGEMLSADELELTGADPRTPVGDVLPRDALVQACRDACQRATELVDLFEAESEMPIIVRDLRGLKPARENVVARYFEILRNLISMQASGSAPRRPWRSEDFGEGKLKLPSGAEIRKFIAPPGNPIDNLKSGWKEAGYADFTERENKNFKLIHQLHWGWCSRASR
jgi:hypothetical protein